MQIIKKKLKINKINKLNKFLKLFKKSIIN